MEHINERLDKIDKMLEEIHHKFEKLQYRKLKCFECKSYHDKLDECCDCQDELCDTCYYEHFVDCYTYQCEKNNCVNQMVKDADGHYRCKRCYNPNPW